MELFLDLDAARRDAPLRDERFTCESAYRRILRHGKVHETVARRAVTETSGRTAYARIASRRDIDIQGR